MPLNIYICPMTHRVRWGGGSDPQERKKIERLTQLKFALAHLWFTRGQHRAEISRLT